jgi:hypothetical protein
MRIIGPYLVDEFYGNKKVGMGAIVAVIDVAYLRQIQLVPVMWSFFTSIAFVLVLDAVTEGILGTREFPGEDMRAVGWVCDCRRISS